ncbi:MAG: Ig-like domain-containing protein, partial [Halioglobus sp.]
MATDRTNLTINLSSDIDLDNIVVSGEALLAYIEEALGEDVDYKLTGKNKRWFDLDEDGNLTFREGFDPDLLSAGKAKVSFQVKDTVDGDSNKEIFDFEFKVEKNPSLLQLQEQVIQNSGGSLGAVTVPDANGEILSVTVVGSDDLEAIEQTIDGVTTWVIQTKSGITDLGSEDIEITLNIITDAGEFYADAIQIQVNDAPVASDDSGLSTNEDTALTISIDTLISNDDDIDAEDAITAASLVDYSQPTNGSLSEGAEGELIYTPNPDYNGPDSFTYTIEDGRGGSDTATVSLTVVAVNDAPVANADSDTVAANSSVIINLAANDTDNDNALDLGSIQIVDSPANGTVEINGNGEITYSSTSAAGGTDSFTYTIADVSGAVSLPATVTITVEAPLGIDGSGQDGYISGALVWADSNPDGVFNEATEASGITNTQGDFSLTGNVSGILHLTGGVDIATLLPFEGLMRAPEGYSVISPLTTLIVAVMEEQGIDDPAIAEAQVKLALDLPDVDFSTFDPIAVLSESTDDDDLEAAEQVFGTASQLLNTVKISGSAVAGASDGGATAESAEQSAYSSLASLVVAVPPPPAEGEPSPEPVNLLSSETITQVVQDTAEDVAQQIAEEEGVDPEDVVIEVESELVADLVTASNTQVEETLSESGGGDVLLGVSEVSQVAQGETAEAVSDGDVSTEDLESYTGEGLDEQVEEAVTGDVDGTTTDPDPESLDDFIIGTAGDDVLDGGPDNGLGNDLISGVGGADTLTGGEGDDTVSGGSGNDIIIAGPGNNTYDGGADFDILDYSAATAGITVDLDAGVASINGFGGSDTVTNMEKIAGSAFADDLTGSDTGAIERFTGNAGSDRIDGGAGNNDGVDHRASTTGSGITADLNLIVDDQDPNVGWGTITDEFGSIDYVKNIERVYGTNDDDEIVGDANNNTFIGYGGNDYIDGGDGYDRLFNNGTETQGMSIDLRIDISEGATNVIDDGYGAAGTILNIEEIFGSNLINAGDVIFGDDNDNGLFGQAGDDILAGFGGNDALVGGEGNDELRAGEGNDYLEGNGGADNFVVSNGSAYIGDFEVGTDTIDL